MYHRDITKTTTLKAIDNAMTRHVVSNTFLPALPALVLVVGLATLGAMSDVVLVIAVLVRTYSYIFVVYLLTRRPCRLKVTGVERKALGSYSRGCVSANDLDQSDSKNLNRITY